MVTGYDHLLFLLGVIFFLYRLKDVGIYVSLFAVGHSVTLLLGVLTEISVSAYLIDAIIGLSVVYKSLDNLGALTRFCSHSAKPASPYSSAATPVRSGPTPYISAAVRTRLRRESRDPPGGCRPSAPAAARSRINLPLASRNNG
jgi:hypothetical protein